VRYPKAYRYLQFICSSPENWPFLWVTNYIALGISEISKNTVLLLR
jgi:hypothetical protein